MSVDGESSLSDSIRAIYLLLFLQIAYPVATVALIIKLFGLHNYGALAPLLVACGVTLLIIDFGSVLYSPALLGGVKNTAFVDKKFAGLIFIRLALAVMVVVIFVAYIELLAPAQHSAYAFAMILLTAFSGVFNFYNKYYSLQRLNVYAIRCLIVRAIAMVTMVVVGIGLENVRLTLSVYFSSSVFLSLWCFDAGVMRQKITKRLLVLTLRRVKRIAPNGVASLVANLTLQIPYLIAAIFFTPVIVGAFHLAGSFVRAVASLSEPVGLAAHAIFGKVRDSSHSINDRAARHRLARLQILTAVGGTVLLLTTALFLRLQGFFYSESIDVLIGVLFIQGFIPLFVAFSSLYMLRFVSNSPRSVIYLETQIIALISFILFAWFAAESYGVFALAGVSVIFEGVMAIVAYWAYCNKRAAPKCDC